MKTRIFTGIIALAAWTGVSCSNDDFSEQQPKNNAIEFGTYLGRPAQAKATGITTETLSNFGVFVYYTNGGGFTNESIPNFMYNQKVAKDSVKGWVYEPVKYWPNNESDRLSFFAYAPYDANKDGENNAYLNLIESTAKGIPSVQYVVATNVTEQVDLLYAAQKDLSKQTIDGKVKFQFAHALSRIGFKVQALVDYVNDQKTQATPDNNTDKGEAIASGTSITVTSVKIKFGSSYRDNGWLNLESGEWRQRTTNNNGDNSYTLTSTDNFETITMSNEPQRLNKEDSYLMILPHSFDGLMEDGVTSDGTDKMSIEVTYVVETTDANLAGGKSSITNTINSGDFTWTFEQGKAYNFVLHLGMTSVKFDAEVTSWVTAEGTDVVVNVPINRK